MRGYGRACVGVCVYFGNTQSSLPGNLQTNIPLPSVNTSRTVHPENVFPENSSRCNTCRSVCCLTSEGQSTRSRWRHGRERFGGCESGWAVIIHETPGLDLTSRIKVIDNIIERCVPSRKKDRKKAFCSQKQTITCNWKLD